MSVVINAQSAWVMPVDEFLTIACMRDAVPGMLALLDEGYSPDKLVDSVWRHIRSIPKPGIFKPGRFANLDQHSYLKRWNWYFRWESDDIYKTITQPWFVVLERARCAPVETSWYEFEDDANWYEEDEY